MGLRDKRPARHHLFLCGLGEVKVGNNVLHPSLSTIHASCGGLHAMGRVGYPTKKVKSAKNIRRVLPTMCLAIVIAPPGKLALTIKLMHF